MSELEIWMPVKGYEKFYHVSNFGRVKRVEGFVTHPITGKKNKKQRERILGLGKKENWYPNFSLCKNGTKINVCVHRLVAIAFIPNPLNKPCVNHIDGNKKNNHVSNLEWVTFQENELHSYKKLGKVATMVNLKNFSPEWDSPLVLPNGLKIAGKRQKTVYKMLLKGVRGSIITKNGYNKSTLYDLVRKLKRNGISVNKTPIREKHWKTGHATKENFYKIAI